MKRYTRNFKPSFLRKALAGAGVAVLLTAGASVVVQAAGESETLEAYCATPYERVTSLLPPRLGAPTVWDARYEKKDKDVQMAAGVVMPEKTVVTTGRVLDADTKKPEHIFIAEINRRGRAVMEGMRPAAPGEHPVDILWDGRAYLVLSSRLEKGTEHPQVGISRYSRKGDYLSSTVLKDERLAYQPHSFMRTEHGDVLVLARTYERAHEGEGRGYTTLFRLDPALKLLWKRSYRTGTPNTLFNLTPLPDGRFMAVGEIEEGAGRKAAWVMLLDENGALGWQQIYLRGRQAVLKHVMPFKDRASGQARYALAGNVEALDKSPQAVWLMISDAYGTPLWQRYYHHDEMAVSVQDFARLDDGRFRFVLNAHALEKSGHRDHIRVLTLDPRGDIKRDETYIEGIEAHAAQSREGWQGERVVFGTVLSDGKPLDIEMIGNKFVVDEETEAERAAGKGGKENEDAKAKALLAGWVLVTAPPDVYKDPCQALAQ